MVARRAGRTGLSSILLLMTLVVGFGASAKAGRVLDAIPREADGWLVVDVATADLLDPRTRSTIESGLPGSCVLEVQLLDAKGRQRVARAVERSLEFDLWEGIVTLREGNAVRTFRSLDAADSAWSRFESIRLARWSDLHRDREYRVRVLVAVRPLGTEERQRVSRWVREGTRSDRRSVAFDVGGLVQAFIGDGDGDEAVNRWTGLGFFLRELVTKRESP